MRRAGWPKNQRGDQSQLGIFPIPGNCCQKYRARKGQMFPLEGEYSPYAELGVLAPPGHPSAGFIFGKLLPPQGRNTKIPPKPKSK